MPRRISSVMTFYVKFVSPVFFIFWAIFFIKISLGWGDDPGEIGLSAIFGAVILGFAIWMSWSLKKVSVDDRNLYVSNYLREITIPISEIADVREFLLSEPRRVTIRLHRPTEFGDKIIFLATYRAFAFLSPHPIVDELTQMAVRRTMTD